MTTDDYLRDMEPGEPESEQDLDERREYVEWERAYPADAKRAKVLWGRQIRVGSARSTAGPCTFRRPCS
jgi:hypothetical protein